MEWKQTVLQLEEDLNCAVAVRAVKEGTALEYMSNQGRVVTIEPYQEMLRKRTDQAGHLPLLQKVKQFHVRTKEQTTTLQVTDVFGQVHEAVFSLTKEWFLKREKRRRVYLSSRTCCHSLFY